MSASFGGRVARRTISQCANKSHTTAVRHMTGPGHYGGKWPGPSPFKDIFIGIGLGLVFASFWKVWQMEDKASRVRFYQLYEAAQKKEEEEQKRKSEQ